MRAQTAKLSVTRPLLPNRLWVGSHASSKELRSGRTEGFGANHQNRAQESARLELAQDEPGLDSLTLSDLVGDQKPRPVTPDELQNRAELIGNEINAACLTRIKVQKAGFNQLERR